MDQEQIGKFICQLRKKNNMSQQQFADILGVTSQAVSKWENGKNIPDISVMKQISKEFKVDIDEIINGKFKDKSNDHLFNKKNIMIPLLIITIFLFICLFLLLRKDPDYYFKTLSTECSSFNISGTVSYNDNKSSIHVSNITYCGEDDTTIYKKIECSLYEASGNTITQIDQSQFKENTNLKDFLEKIEFIIDNYNRVCKSFEDNSLYLQITATNNDEKNITYKIPLKLSESCNK